MTQFPLNGSNAMLSAYCSLASPYRSDQIGPPAALDTPRAVYEAAVAALGDGVLTTVVLVARPDRAALAEAGRAAGQLAALGITRQQLVVNAVLAGPLQGDKDHEHRRPPCAERDRHPARRVGGDEPG